MTIFRVALLLLASGCWVTRQEIDDKIAEFEPTETATPELADTADTGASPDR
ncbi:MAG: hypothetical protein AAGA48_40600 [Myxococcota bacterium]